MLDRAERETRLAAVAESYLNTVLENIVREYPVAILLTAIGPGSIPSHRELHPAFYGCFDWHSCVELHWVAVRLLRRFPDLPNAESARAVLRSLLIMENLETELAFFQLPHQQGWERPYGWGWFLTFHHELATWDDPDGQAWAAATRPLAQYIAAGFKAWLPKLTYPVRCGFHPNTAFALARSLEFAQANDPELADLIAAQARNWFAEDADYPVRNEPSGSDFLSATLTEAELMVAVMEPGSFLEWFDRFLPGLAIGNQGTLFEPAIVSDATDGHIAHLHGLNLYRAFGMVRVAACLPEGDSRRPVLLEMAERHATASLPFVSGSDYMVEHWLAAYATLLLTA